MSIRSEAPSYHETIPSDKPHCLAPQARELRIFVSSTFSDMTEERNILSSHVFPQIRELCERRGIIFSDIDLRWGVTEEQRAESQVLPRCLAEIDRARPYFIGILGDRYGWIPDQISLDLSTREPWLSDHRDRSVTEIEIMHGVFNRSSETPCALFYFRTPRPLTPSASDSTKLQALKTRIRAAHSKGQLSLREEFPDARALGDWVLEDLRLLVEREFPEQDDADELDQEIREQSAFARSHTRHFVGRDEEVRELAQTITAGRARLIVCGDAGMGKSALLASLAQHVRNLSAAGGQDIVVVEHYVGASRLSGDWQAAILLLLRQLRTATTQDFPDPDSYSGGPRAALADALRRIAEKERAVLVVLDAVDQLDDARYARDLWWLPQELPQNVSFVVSTLPDDSLGSGALSDWFVHHLPPLDAKGRKTMARAHLESFGKSMSNDAVDRIIAAEGTGSPRYLHTLLEELRQWGVHDTLSRDLTAYLRAPRLVDLYATMFVRWEQLYEDDGTLIGDVLGLLSCARRGLSMPELREILARNGEPLPHAILLPLVAVADRALIDRSGLIGIASFHAHDAVITAYLPDPAMRAQVRRRIVAYFSTKPLTTRVVDEIAWQLFQLEDWAELYEALSAVPFLIELLGASIQDARRYWVEIETRTMLRMGDAYGDLSLDSCDQEVLQQISTMLAERQHFEVAGRLRGELTAHARAKGDRLGLARCLSNESEIPKWLEDYDRALALLDEAIQLKQDAGDVESLAPTLGNKAVVLKRLGRLLEASAICSKVQSLCRQQSKLVDLRTSLCNHSQTLSELGELPKALAALEEALDLCKRMGWRDEVPPILEHQAQLFMQLHRPSEGLALLQRAEPLRRAEGNLQRLAYLLVNQSILEHEPTRILDLTGEAESLLLESDDVYVRGRMLGRRAVALGQLGRSAEARALFQLAASVLGQSAQVLSQEVYVASHALVDEGKGEYAVPLLEEAIALEQQGPVPEARGRLMRFLALVLRELGRRQEAEPVLAHALSILRVHGSRDELASTLCTNAELLNSLGKESEAIAHLNEAAALLPGLDSTITKVKILVLTASVHAIRAEVVLAQAVLQRAAEITAEEGTQEEHASTVAAHARWLRGEGRPHAAVSFINCSAAAWRGAGDESALVLLLGCQAELLELTGNAQEATSVKSEVQLLEDRQKQRAAEARRLHKQADQLREHSSEEIDVRRHEIELLRTLRDEERLADALATQGHALAKMGSAERAVEHFEEALVLYRQQERRELTTIVLSSLAIALRDLEKFEPALTILEEEASLLRQLGNVEELASSLNDRALLLRDLRRVGEMRDVYWELASLHQQRGDDTSAFVTLSLAEMALDAFGDAEGALACWEEVQRILERLGDHATLTRLRQSRELRGRPTPIDTPKPHPAADPNAAAARNIAYQQALDAWRKLPWWRRLLLGKPRATTF